MSFSSKKYLRILVMILLLVVTLQAQSLSALSSGDGQSSTDWGALQTEYETYNETEPNNTRSQANRVNSSYHGWPSYYLVGTFPNFSTDVDYYRIVTTIPGEITIIGIWLIPDNRFQEEGKLAYRLEDSTGKVIQTSYHRFSMWHSSQFLSVQIPVGTYYLKVNGAENTSLYSGAKYKLDMTFTPDCWVGIQPKPIGPASGNILTAYEFSAHDHISECGAPVQTQFDWGDGTYSSWSTTHTRSKSWANSGTYSVRARERCSLHNAVVGDWSGPLSITLAAPYFDLIVQTADPVKGTVSGSTHQKIGTSVTVSAAPAPDYRFYRWQRDSDVVNRTNPYTFTLMDNLTLTGYFRPAINSSRLYGNNRYTTAAAISQTGWPDGAVTVVLARGDNYADALAGVPLAFQMDAPILLTSAQSLHASTKTEIQRLEPLNVIILGGTGAISADVESELLDMGLNVERVYGATRYLTAVEIAKKMRFAGNDFHGTLLAVGSNFPDALSAASYAAMTAQPILLTTMNALHPSTAATLDELDIQEILIVGGSGVISTEVEDELKASYATIRVSGSNRYLTSIALAEHFVPDALEYCLATGSDFPDAITGAALAAKKGTGILLVLGNAAMPPASIQDYLVDNLVEDVTLFGGTSVISEIMQDWF